MVDRIHKLRNVANNHDQQSQFYLLDHLPHETISSHIYYRRRLGKQFHHNCPGKNFHATTAGQGFFGSNLCGPAAMPATICT